MGVHGRSELQLLRRDLRHYHYLGTSSGCWKKTSWSTSRGGVVGCGPQIAVEEDMVVKLGPLVAVVVVEAAAAASAATAATAAVCCLLSAACCCLLLLLPLLLPCSGTQNM